MFSVAVLFNNKNEMSVSSAELTALLSSPFSWTFGCIVVVTVSLCSKSVNFKVLTIGDGGKIVDALLSAKNGKSVDGSIIVAFVAFGNNIAKISDEVVIAVVLCVVGLGVVVVVPAVVKFLS